MPVIVDWRDDAQTILHMQIMDPWTMSDLIEATQASYRLMEQAGCTVDLIMDGTATNGLPRNVLTHYATNTKDSTIPANQGFVLVVVRSALLQTFVTIAKRALPQYTKKMYMVASLPAADTKIAELRASEQVLAHQPNG